MRDNADSEIVAVTTALAGPVSSYNTFTLREWCSNNNVNAACPSTYSHSLQVTGFNNPANARFPTNSIRIEITTSAGAIIDSITTSFFSTP